MRWRAWTRGRSSTPASRRSSSPSSDESFVRAIIEAPDDPAPYLVYSDWLIEQGDPRGELIAMDHGGLIAERRALIAQHPSLVGAIEDWGLAEWKYGFVSKLVIEAGYYDRERADLEVREVLQGMLAHPACRFLRTLEIGDLWGDAEHRVLFEVLPPLSLLEELRIEPQRRAVDYGSTVALARCPRLRRLALLLSSETDRLCGQLSLRGLTHLNLSGGMLSDEGARYLAAHDAKLEVLDVRGNHLLSSRGRADLATIAAVVI